MTLQTIILRFSIVELVFNSIWAAVAVNSGYDYSAGLWMSLVTYSVVGFVAAQRFGHRAAMLAGAAVACVDATLSFLIAYALGVYGTLALPSAWWFAMMGLFAITLPLVGASFGALGALSVPARATRR
jgi:hypothetical protein